MDNNPVRYNTSLEPSQIVYEWIQKNGDILDNVSKRCKRETQPMGIKMGTPY